uniref:Uncharacterized protein n=1 Tax=Arundo donax TaxID=35708 RepID=A0A0A9CAJ4_ARUDO
MKLKLNFTFLPLNHHKTTH